MFDCCITLRYGSKKDCRSDAWRFHGDDHLTTVVSCTTVLSQVSAVSGLSSSVSDSRAVYRMQSSNPTQLVEHIWAVSFFSPNITNCSGCISCLFSHVQVILCLTV